VSRKHAVFTKEGERWHLEDQGSLNGTFVNRERVEAAELRDGDELQIGKYRLTFLQR
jgi:pSer/pThr/pTyr-binding forkhead associated (FHA) protein